MINYYDVLNVEKDATEKEIRQAYRSKSLLCHPDRNDSEEAKGQFLLISEAVEHLTNSQKRRLLDEFLRIEELKRERTREMDERRRKARDELEVREQSQRTFTAQEQKKLDIQRIREQEMEKRQALQHQRAQEQASRLNQAIEQSALENVSVEDCTLKGKVPKDSGLDADAITRIMQEFGPLESVKVGKSGKSCMYKAKTGQRKIKLDWMSGSEPSAVRYLPSLKRKAQTAFSVNSSTVGKGQAYEDATLRRLEERAKLTREILNSEAKHF